MILTKAQRVALKRVFDRGPVFNTEAMRDMTYREFRRSVQIGCDCIMVKWCGMWLGIETDGYTHS